MKPPRAAATLRDRRATRQNLSEGARRAGEKDDPWLRKRLGEHLFEHFVAPPSAEEWHDYIQATSPAVGNRSVSRHCTDASGRSAGTATAGVPRRLGLGNQGAFFALARVLASFATFEFVPTTMTSSFIRGRIRTSAQRPSLPANVVLGIPRHPYAAHRRTRSTWDQANMLGRREPFGPGRPGAHHVTSLVLQSLQMVLLLLAGADEKWTGGNRPRSACVLPPLMFAGSTPLHVESVGLGGSEPERTCSARCSGLLTMWGVRLVRQAGRPGGATPAAVLVFFSRSGPVVENRWWRRCRSWLLLL